MTPRHLRRIISGCQTGVDRAALDVALALRIPCGGWVPRGRRAEDGRISDRYPVREAQSSSYAERTRLNVRDSDATLILAHGALSGGTALTLAQAQRMRRPALVIDLTQDVDLDSVRDWLDRNNVAVLNVAGPRESSAPGSYAQARSLLGTLLGTLLITAVADARSNPATG